MKKLFVVAFLAVAVLSASPCAFAKEGKPAAGKFAKVKIEQVEKTGVLEVKAKEKGEKYNTVTLKVGEAIFRLIPGKGSKGKFDAIEKMAGKEITVKGGLLPANEKHPLDAIKVDSFEAKGGAATPAAVSPATPAPAPAPAPAPETKPADPKPADEKPAEGK